MAVLLWLFLLLVAFIALLALSPQVRKQVLIITTYVSLTGWYYYRQWEKSHQGDAPVSSRPKSRGSSSTSTSSSKRRVELDSETDVRYFEPADKVLHAAHDGQEDNLSQRSMSENSYRLSEASSSGNSEDPTGKKNKKHSGGIFRKSKAENQDETRLSDVSISSQVSSSTTVTTNTSSTRRTYSGRKKPASWGN